MMRGAGCLRMYMSLALGLVLGAFAASVLVRVPAGRSGKERAGQPHTPIPAASTGPKKPPLPPQPSQAWKLAFVREGDVWVARGDGTGQKLLLKNGGSPCWSPDRKQIAFARDGNVWVANADGSGQRQLTFRWKKDDPPEPNGNDYLQDRVDLSWDPQQNVITFSHWEEFWVARVGSKEGKVIVGWSIFDVPVNSTRQEEAIVRFDLYDEETFFHFSNHSHPTWSKSGKRLAFVRNGDIWVAERGCKLYLEEELSWTPWEWSAWEWEVTRLAAVASYDAPTYRGSRENHAVTHLSWSPDERYLAYAYERLLGSGTEGIELLDVAEGKERTLVVLGLEPCFSPDGKIIAYWNFQEEGIWMVSLGGQTNRKLVDNAEQPAW